MPNWRDIARPIIAQVIAARPGAAERELRIELRKVYPFGERAYHPYRIWCDEVRRQLGKPRNRNKRKLKAIKLVVEATRAQGLFDQVECETE